MVSGCRDQPACWRSVLQNESNLRTYIILVNWNGWQDTLDCVLSLLRSVEDRFTIFICDNGSTNDSCLNIDAWGINSVNYKSNSNKNYITDNAIQEFSYITLEKSDLRPGILENVASRKSREVVLLKIGENKGFAAGCNWGIKFALEDKSCDFVWLLNNDTEVEVTSLSSYRAYMHDNPAVGIAGAVVLYHHNPTLIQTLGGGIYNRFLGTQKAICEGFVYDEKQVLESRVLERMSFVYGASMFVRREFIDEIGLLSEDYFIYFEESDWVERLKVSGWKMGFSTSSIIYHKEGASIGGNSRKPKEKSQLADYYSIRSRILFAKRYNKKWLWLVYCGVGFSIILRLVRKRPDRAMLLFNVLVEMLKRKPN